MTSFWEIVENRRKILAISRAEMARRAGISESTVTYGLKRGTRPIPSVRRQVERVLSEEEQSQAGEVA